MPTSTPSMAEKSLAMDYIICGGGTAGCVLASRLKQSNPTLSVALIEKGKDERKNPVVLNPMGVSQLDELGIVSKFKTEPQSSLGNRQVELSAGDTLSGSSAINYGLWMRGSSRDYDRWAQLVQNRRWSYEGILPYFKRSETHYDADGDKGQHGFEGPIKTASGRHYPLHWETYEAFVELGLSHNADSNGGKPHGIGSYTENWTPVRQPAGVAYDLSGVNILTHTAVSKVPIRTAVDGGACEAKGVELEDGRYLEAKKEIILCCGVFGTPQILNRSGIGPASHLSKLGIDVVVNNSNVGTLFDHVACHLCWKLDPAKAESGLAMGSQAFFSNPTYMQGLPVDWMAIDSLPPEDGAAVRMDDRYPAPSTPRADYWMMITYMPLALGKGYDVPMDGQHITTTVLNLQPTSRGYVSLRSPDPQDAPIIDPCYNSTPRDQYTMRSAVRKSLQLVHSDSLKPYIVGEEAPAGYPALTVNSTDAEIDDRIRNYSTTINHGAGTAAMGKVVDADLKVFGVMRLRVCDASVFPAPVSAGPQATVYAAAEKLADMMLGEISQGSETASTE